MEFQPTIGRAKDDDGNDDEYPLNSNCLQTNLLYQANVRKFSKIYRGIKQQKNQ